MVSSDSWGPVTTERGPQAEDHCPSLVEGDLIVGLNRPGPAERLVERAGTGQVLHAERHHRDALFDGLSIADGVRADSYRCCCCRRTGPMAPMAPTAPTVRIVRIERPVACCSAERHRFLRTHPPAGPGSADRRSALPPGSRPTERPARRPLLPGWPDGPER